MAKKVVKKKVSKKSVSTKKVAVKMVSPKSVSSRKAVSKKAPTERVALKKSSRKDFVSPVKNPKSKINVSVNSLAFFGILFLISIVSYGAVSHVMYKELFFLLSLAFASISVALILVLLIYFFYSRINISRK